MGRFRLRDRGRIPLRGRASTLPSRRKSTIEERAYTTRHLSILTSHSTSTLKRITNSLRSRSSLIRRINSTPRPLRYPLRLRRLKPRQEDHSSCIRNRSIRRWWMWSGDMTEMEEEEARIWRASLGVGRREEGRREEGRREGLRERRWRDLVRGLL